MTRSQRGRLALVGALTIAFVYAPAATSANAEAWDNMYPTGTMNYINYPCSDTTIGNGHPCNTDNATLTIFRESSLDASGKTNIKSALDAEYQPTDLTVSYVATPEYSGGAETDIIYQNRGSAVPAGSYAVTWCNDAANGQECDQAYVAFDIAYPWVATACHETGHAVGLTHGAQAYPPIDNQDPALACMRATTFSNYIHLSTWEQSEINAQY
jgi:hypothetical protein